MAGERNNYGKRSYSQSDYNDNERSKRRNNGDDRGKTSHSSDDTVYRYLCPSRKIGSIMGRGGDTIKQLRSETNSKIRIGDTVSGCEDRVITVYSTSDETNKYDGNERICPAQDALLKVHDRLSDEVAADVDSGDKQQVTARLLVPCDQIGCIIGKGGQIVQTIRSDTGAQIRIMKDRNLPKCALSDDELVQISGEASHVKVALFQIASRLHDNPSKSEQIHTSSTRNSYPSTGAPIMGLNPLVGPYGGPGGYKGENGDWAHNLYPPSRHESSSKEFSLHLICPTANLGAVIGKGGAMINQIRQESGATVKVDSSTSATENEDCIISIFGKEIIEDTFSPTIEAAVRLQPRCSERIESDSGVVSFTTRLLVPTSQIGCIIGKGGAIISEIRRISRSNIRIVSRENIPKIADKDEQMVQITAELDNAKDALIQVITRLRGNFFEREGVLSTFVPVHIPYLPVAPESPKYERRHSRSRERVHSYSGRYRDLSPNDRHRSYEGRSNNDAYGAYSSHSSGRSGNSRSRHNPGSRQRDHGY